MQTAMYQNHTSLACAVHRRSQQRATHFTPKYHMYLLGIDSRTHNSRVVLPNSTMRTRSSVSNDKLSSNPSVTCTNSSWGECMSRTSLLTMSAFRISSLFSANIDNFFKKFTTNTRNSTLSRSNNDIKCCTMLRFFILICTRVSSAKLSKRCTATYSSDSWRKHWSLYRSSSSVAYDTGGHREYHDCLPLRHHIGFYILAHSKHHK